MVAPECRIRAWQCHAVTHDNINRRQLGLAPIKEAQLQQAQKMESVGRLAGGVAHDFNNMLGVILGHAELAMQSVEPMTPGYRNLIKIYDAAEHSAELTRQLLAFARRQTAIPKVLDLNETISGMLKMLRRLIGEDIDLLEPVGHRFLHQRQARRAHVNTIGRPIENRFAH